MTGFGRVRPTIWGLLLHRGSAVVGRRTTALYSARRNVQTLINPGPSPIDLENEMFQLRRTMMASYTQGKYRTALDIAMDLNRRAVEAMGTRNAVYATTLNNVALMHKMLGEQDKALENYSAALSVYLDIKGKEYSSYAATLANMGVLYKEMSRGHTKSRARDVDSQDDEGSQALVPVSSEERQELLENAQQALTEARDIRLRILGANHRDTLYSSIHLASLLRMRDQAHAALAMLEEALSTAEEAYSSQDAICGSIRNDLGVLHKALGNMAEAKDHYTRALAIHRKQRGDSHNDTVVTAYNLAELHNALGETAEATALQELLVKTIEDRDQGQQGQGHQGVASSASTVVSAGGVKMTVHRQVNSAIAAKPVPTATTSTTTTTSAVTNTAVKAAAPVTTAHRPPKPARTVHKNDASAVLRLHQERDLVEEEQQEGEDKKEVAVDPAQRLAAAAAAIKAKSAVKPASRKKPAGQR